MGRSSECRPEWRVLRFSAVVMAVPPTVVVVVHLTSTLAIPLLALLACLFLPTSMLAVDLFVLLPASVLPLTLILAVLSDLLPSIQRLGFRFPASDV